MLDQLAVPTRTSTAYEHVRAALRGALLDGTIPAGSRLVQTELANALGVSTTPVREALRDLAKEGLVIIDAHKGALARPLKMSEVREIYQLRITLEPLMAARVVDKLSDEQLQHAEELQKRMAHETDIGLWVNLNREFHAAFSLPDRGSRLAEILDNLRDNAAPYVALSLNSRPQQVAESNHEHAQLLENYRRQELAEVTELTVQHLQSTLREIEDAHNRNVI